MKKATSVPVQGYQSPGRTQTKSGFSTPDKSHPRSATTTSGTELNTPEKRHPLTPIQKKRGRGENEMVGRQKSKSSEESSSSSSKQKAIHKVQAGFIAKRKLTDKSIQTDSSSDIITSDEPTLEYWKLLAEERRVALEDALRENQTLSERVECLEADNSRLCDMLEDAKALAEMINSISEDADESGIVKDEGD